MSRLMAKFKNGEWKEIDHTNPDSDFPEQEQKDYLLSEYKLTLGQGWMFKWEE